YIVQDRIAKNRVGIIGEILKQGARWRSGSLAPFSSDERERACDPRPDARVVAVSDSSSCRLQPAEKSGFAEVIRNKIIIIENRRLKLIEHCPYRGSSGVTSFAGHERQGADPL